MAGEGSKKTQFKSTGLGITNESKTFGFKINEKYEDVLIMLPNRSQKIREWVIQGMLREGLIEDNEYDNSY
ncbi:hypothetical protein [Iningainema tapete]|uniref:Uncharacterized protein n=1 Tax=Iningainema tapete BLCC-T55 TaxID=2748662 RepID=A0A8J6XV84_9CYAN|nr:hypothetical protein [Iningainema tapete]MBD2776752.1 hypothetical protein [Iningainema tapete BLCC-T55]